MVLRKAYGGRQPALSPSAWGAPDLRRGDRAKRRARYSARGFKTPCPLYNATLRKRCQSPTARSPMTTTAPASGRGGSAEEADDAPDAGFKPLSAEQAHQWRAANPPLSPWPVVGAQAAAGLAAVAVAWMVSAGGKPVVWSTAYGALAAWLPAVLFARMVARRMRRQADAGGALLALMVGEGIKIVLTVVLLLAAPRVLAQVHWLALLAGFVVTLKVAWAALWWMSARRR